VLEGSAPSLPRWTRLPSTDGVLAHFPPTPVHLPPPRRCPPARYL